MNQSEYDAWTVDALHRADVPPDRLAAVSDRFRGLAGRLAALPLEDRADACEAALCMLNGDADAFRKLMDANPGDGSPDPADIEEDAPAADASAWPPLRLAERPAVQDFPLDVLPIPARDLAIEAARTIGCQPDFVAVACLGVASGAIGRSVSLLRWENYFASACLYTAVVGDPTSGKSPAMAYAAAPTKDVETGLERKHKAAVASWGFEVKQLGPKAKEADKPPRPKRERFRLDNVTNEKLILMLRDAPRGLFMLKDEISSLPGGFGQYKAGRGHDKEDYCSMWSGAPLFKDRVLDENGDPVYVPHPFLAIVGGTVPGSLWKFADPTGAGDGFLERFLFAVPDPRPRAKAKDRKRGVSDGTAAAWADVVHRLLSRGLNGDHPHVVFMDEAADAAMDALMDAHSDEMDAPSFPPWLKPAWGKLDEYAGRLALVLCLMERASDPTADARALPRVTESHVVNAWRLVDYFKTHAERVRWEIDPIGAGPRAREVRAITLWIKAGKLATFTEHELTQAREWLRRDHDALVEALGSLAKAGAIRRRPDGSPGAKGGRPASPAFDVNPALTSP